MCLHILYICQFKYILYDLLLYFMFKPELLSDKSMPVYFLILVLNYVFTRLYFTVLGTVPLHTVHPTTNTHGSYSFL